MSLIYSETVTRVEGATCCLGDWEDIILSGLLLALLQVLAHCLDEVFVAHLSHELLHLLVVEEGLLEILACDELLQRIVPVFEVRLLQLALQGDTELLLRHELLVRSFLVQLFVGRLDHAQVFVFEPHRFHELLLWDLGAHRLQLLGLARLRLEPHTSLFEGIVLVRLLAEALSILDVLGQ